MMRLFVITLLFAADLFCADRFYSDHKDTWFFGVDEIEVVDDRNATSSAPVEEEERLMSEDAFIKNIPWGDLDSLSASEFQATIKKTKEIAVVRPTPENTAAYIRLQKHATDQASRFMRAWQIAVIQDPSLTDNLPSAKRLRDQKSKGAAEMKDAFMMEHREKITLVMFYDADDMTSARSQLSELMALERRFGIRIQSVSIQDNPAYVDTLGLQLFPENWYYYQDETGSSWRRIGAGLRSANELLDNLLLIHNATEEVERR